MRDNPDVANIELVVGWWGRGRADEAIWRWHARMQCCWRRNTWRYNELDKYATMITEKIVLATLMASGFSTAILYIIFGQFTVRKLRKNSRTIPALGGAFISGWNIISVAQVLSLRQVIIRRLWNSPLSFLELNTVLLNEHNSVIDWLFAGRCFWLMMFTVRSFVLWTLVDAVGLLN